MAAYRGFESSSFHIVAVFDREPENIGTQTPAGVRIMSDVDITAVVRAMGIQMGIVAVPMASAQDVANALVAGGVTAILNYAPVILRVPSDVWVREIDPTGAMQSMTYYLSNRRADFDPAPTANACVQSDDGTVRSAAD